MDTVSIIAATMGVAWASGINLICRRIYARLDGKHGHYGFAR